MQRSRANILKIAAVLVDLLLVNASYVAAFFIRFMGSPPGRNFTPYMLAIPFVTLTSLAYIDLFGMLKFYRQSRRAALAAVMKFVPTQGLTTIAIAYTIGDLAFPRSILLLIAPAIQVVLLAGWNWLVLGLRAAIHDTPQAMLIGGDAAVAAFLEMLARAEPVGRKRRSMDVKHVHAPEDRAGIAESLAIADEVIICPDVPEAAKAEILVACAGSRKVVYFVPEVLEISMLNAGVINIGDMPLCIMDSLELTPEQRFFKRAFDIALTCAAVPLLSPAMAAIAAAVKLTSPGRALYSQERVTAGGRVYRIYKFRTMGEDAEAATGPVLSGDGDDRVTKVGRFLRRYRLDELPQLFNVLRGDMSLVGPRSERPLFVERYTRGIEGYQLRNNVKAGLTGYAQVYGYYGTSPEMKLKLDVLYIRNYSLLLDAKLILLTFHAIMKKGSS